MVVVVGGRFPLVPPKKIPLPNSRPHFFKLHMVSGVPVIDFTLGPRSFIVHFWPWLKEEVLGLDWS